MSGYLIGAAVVVAGFMVSELLTGFINGVLDRRPTCAYCGKRQRGAMNVQWARHMPDLWDIRSDFWLCSRHSGRVVEYTGKLDAIAERMNTATDRESNQPSTERGTT